MSQRSEGWATAMLRLFLWTPLDPANLSRANIYFNIISPSPGTFIIALHFKGREKPILEMDLKIDDLLEKQQKDADAALDLEYVQLHVTKVLALFNKLFTKRR